MTILTALAGLYGRLAEAGEAPRQGYSTEKIGGEVVINLEGQLIAINPKLVPDGKKLVPAKIDVPASVKRASGIAPNFLWDKTAYVLGVTAQKDERGKPLLQDGLPVPAQERRTAEEHAAFVALHCDRLAGTQDAGLRALLRFLDGWYWEDFAARDFPADLLDQNLVFRLDGESGYLHDRPTVAALLAGNTGHSGPLCLVTGERTSVARLHPNIKGVAGAQSSGASLVSFNDRAYESFGKKQGDNAPVSEGAAFAYGTALNALLARSVPGLRQRALRIGDATTVFWAETPDREGDEVVEDFLAAQLASPAPDKDEHTTGEEEEKLRLTLEALARGQRPDDPRFTPETRVYVLGLSPNAARLSVRFWLPGTLGEFSRNVARFHEDMRIEPPAWKRIPAPRALLYETALQREAKNIPPLLGGALMRAVLGGQSYPRLLLSATIGRIRVDGIINGPRAAICKAVLSRNLKEEFPVSLDPDNPNAAYRLGRLFALLEGIQQAALPGLNATIRDRFFAAASATPARVFPLLAKTATHHLANLRKADKAGLAHWFDAQIGEVWSGLSPDVPPSLTLEEQGRFVAGYYHQKFTRPAPKEAGETLVEASE